MPTFHSFIRKTPPEEGLPPARETPLAPDEYQQLAKGKCFDVQRSFGETLQWITEQPLESATVQVSTVRSGDDMLESPLGNLSWLAAAKRAQLQGTLWTKIVDFYDDPTCGAGDIETICDELKFVPDRTTLYRAEEFPFDEELFSRLQKLVRAHPALAEKMSDLHKDLRIPEPVRNGLAHLREGRMDSAREQLARLIEEIKAFLPGHDNPKNFLLMSHEAATISLMRMMFDFRKKIIQLHIPMNEYRAGKSFVKQLAGQCIRGEQYRPSGNGDLAIATATIIDGCNDWLQQNDRQHLDERRIEVVADLGGAPLMCSMAARDGYVHTEAVVQKIRYGNVPKTPEAICELILSNQDLQAKPDISLYSLRTPFVELVARHGENLRLLAQTLLHFLQRTASMRSFSHHCVFNPLLDYLIKLEPVKQALCAEELDAIRQLMREELLQRAHQSALQLAQKDTQTSKTIPFARYQELSQKFLGPDVTFASPPGYEERKKQRRERDDESDDQGEELHADEDINKETTRR